MASSSFSSGLMLQVAVVWAAVLALSSPAEGGVNQVLCISPISSLMPCQSYVQNASATPSSACCTALTQVIQTQPLCLCAILDGEAGRWLGFNIDLYRALDVPSACAVQPPPLSLCLNVTTIQPSSTPGGQGYYYSGVSSDAGLNKMLFFGLLLVVTSSLTLKPIAWF